MASNLACVGLAVSDTGELRSLIRGVMPHAEKLGEADGVDVMRWQDSSGARLILGVCGHDVPDLLPSFAATPSAKLASIDFVSADVAKAAVLDDENEQVTALAIEFEERRLLRRDPAITEGVAGITALGIAVEVFPSADAFAASPASLLRPEGAPTDPPPHYGERGWNWPPRVGSESFFSYGVFAQEQPSAHARLAGTVLDADVRTVDLTGQRFVHARVRTVGFDADVCFPADDQPPPNVGAIVHGTVFLVGTMTRQDSQTVPGWRWFRRRR
jgi:hypothetical protein